MSEIYQYNEFNSIFVLKYTEIPTLETIPEIFDTLLTKTKNLDYFYLLVDVFAFKEKPSTEIRDFIKKTLKKSQNLSFVSYVTDKPEIFSVVPQFVLSETKSKFTISSSYEEAIEKINKFHQSSEYQNNPL